MIKKIFLGLILTSFMLTSCNLDLEPLNGPVTGDFPASEEELEMGVLATYKGLSLLDAASTPILHVMDNITDIGYTRPGANYTPAITSAIQTNNPLVNKPYTLHYKTIARCHLVLDNIEKLKGEIPEDRYKKYEAEVRFVRAYCYSQMIELYGSVPLLVRSLNLNNTDVPKTEKRVIEQWLLNELEEIADDLPSSQPKYRTVRATSVAAYMLLARIALNVKRYQLAADAAEMALTLADGLHNLTAFDNSIAHTGKSHSIGEPECSNIFGYAGYSGSKEWIWTLEYNYLVPSNTHNQGFYLGSRLGRGCSYWGPTQNLIDSFQDTDGNSIDQSLIYDAAKPFENRDPRLDMYCARPSSRFMGFQFEPSKTFANVKNYWPVMEGTSAVATNVTNTDATNEYRSFSGYYWRKYTDLADYYTNGSKGYSDQDIGIFRLSELLLIYAEAKIELGQIDASVYEAINKIRSRALMPDLPSNLNQAAMRTALRYERKVELCNDGLRWYDLRRWDIAKDVMSGYIYLNRAGSVWDADVLVKIDENHNPVYDHAKAIAFFNAQEVVYQVGKDEVWPLPQKEMDANKALIQNPHY